MGYILPVNHYQYAAYHNRVNMPEKSPYEIEEMKRVEFYADNTTRSFNQADPQLMDFNSSDQSKQGYNPPTIPPQLSELTGQGKIVDTYI